MQFRTYDALCEGLKCLRLPTNALENWIEFTKGFMNQNTINKFEIPTQQEIDSWVQMTKECFEKVSENKRRKSGKRLSDLGLTVLQKIKLPMLAGWSSEQVIEGITPYLYQNIKKYKSNRFGEDDCAQVGAVGVMNAIRTDAGKSTFATHAYSHIRTSIRRASVNSSLTMDRKGGERIPSSALVRRLITAYLTGDVLGWHRDDLAQRYKKGKYSKFVNYEQIPGNVIRDYVRTKYKSRYELLRKAINNEGDALEYEKAVDEACIKLLKHEEGAKVKSLREEAKKIQKTITEEARNLTKRLVDKAKKSGLEIKRLIHDSELRTVRIQKTGNNRAYSRLIRLDFQLIDLGMTEAWELFDFINWRYSYLYDSTSAKSILPPMDLTKFESIGDVICAVASNPDFHGAPVALDAKSDKDGKENRDYADKNAVNPSVNLENSDEAQHRKRLIEMTRGQLELTYEQEVVLCFTYGLPLEHSKEECERLQNYCTKEIDENAPDSKSGTIHEQNGKWFYTPEPTSGSWLAANFGELVRRCLNCGAFAHEHVDGKCEKTGCSDLKIRDHVSRQRITQYDNKSEEKLRSKMFELVFKNKTMQHEYVLSLMSKLSLEERNLAKFVFDLFPINNKNEIVIEKTDVDVKYITDNYDSITGANTGTMPKSARRELVKEAVSKIQHKMLAKELINKD